MLLVGSCRHFTGRIKIRRKYIYKSLQLHSFLKKEVLRQRSLLFCRSAKIEQHLLFDDGLARFKQQDRNLAQVKVDKMFCFMCDVTAKVTANNAVPCWVVFFIKFLFDKGGNVFFNVVFFKSLTCTIDGILLHVFRHVCVFDNSFSFGHDSRGKE